MHEAPREPWPLTAAATAVLRDPKEDASTVLKLALKELVLRRTWRIERVSLPRRWRAPAEEVLIGRGSGDPPEADVLRRLDAALRLEVDGGTPELQGVVRDVLRRSGDLPKELREAARREAQARGLLVAERRKVLGVVPRTVWSRTVWSRTASGDSWVAGSYELEDRLQRALPDRRAVPAHLAAVAGLVLLLDPPVLAELDEVLAELRRAGDGAPVSGGDTGGAVDVPDLDLPDLDGLFDLDIIDGSVDSAVDSAVDSGGGGDRGGDGGGGGGD